MKLLSAWINWLLINFEIIKGLLFLVTKIGLDNVITGAFSLSCNSEMINSNVITYALSIYNSLKNSFISNESEK